ncbi:MAG: hypothetical protein AB7D43_05225 [Sulfurimonadaceae bacterium]
MIYKIYIAFFFLSLFVYHFDKISKKIKPLFYKTKNAVKNPRIGRDISLAVFANGLFSVLNSNSSLSAYGYFILTLLGAYGIIVANDKLQD